METELRTPDETPITEYVTRFRKYCEDYPIGTTSNSFVLYLCNEIETLVEENELQKKAFQALVKSVG